jgi:hypothetical protein
VSLRVRTNAPPGYSTTIFAGTRAVSAGRREQDFTVDMPDGPAVYRAEVRPDGRDMPWIISNAIYVRPPQGPEKLPTRPPATANEPLFDGKTTKGWQIETDPRSVAALEVTTGLAGPELRLRYALASDTPSGFAALTYTTPNGLALHNRVTFTIRAERPMRISVQLRNEAKPEGERWQRTVYFDDLTPIGVTGSWRPGLPDIRGIIFAVDLTNSKPGFSGRVWMKDVVLQH